MTSGNFWDSDVWSFILILGTIGLTVLVAEALRNNVKWLKRSLIPSSVLGGMILLIISTIVFYATGGKDGGKYLFELPCFNGGTMSGMTILEILTYHCLGLGFVATALRPGNKKLTKQRAGEVFDSGVTTVSGYLLQGILGLVITIVAVLIGTKIWEGAGVLLPFGYGQGTGQAMNYGSMYGNSEMPWGFESIESGRSFGLAVAAMGFLSACIGGVIYMNVMRRKGKIVIKDEQKENITFDQIIGPNDTPMSGSVDKLTIQIGIVVAVYAVSYCLMEGICSLLNLGESMRATIFGFNFLIGTFLAIALKSIITGLHRKGRIKRRFLNGFMMNRISGFVFDFMVVAGIAAIRIDAISEYIGTLLIMGVIGALATYFYVKFICEKLFKDYAPQQFLAFYGMLTGTASTGIILLREIDDQFETPAADNLVYQNLPAIVFGFPLMLLGTFVYTGSEKITSPLSVYITLGLLVVFFVILQIILFRRKIFRKKSVGNAETATKAQTPSE